MIFIVAATATGRELLSSLYPELPVQASVASVMVYAPTSTSFVLYLYVQASVVDTLGIPVKFVGVGEGLEDLQPFDPESFVDALFPS